MEPTPAATATRPPTSAPTMATTHRTASTRRPPSPARKPLAKSAVASPSAIQPSTAIVAAFRAALCAAIVDGTRRRAYGCSHVSAGVGTLQPAHDGPGPDTRMRGSPHWGVY